jgi:hypothetical protein
MNSAIKFVWTQTSQQTCWKGEQIREVIVTSSSGSTQVAKANER